MTADPVTNVTWPLAPWMHQSKPDERRARFRAARGIALVAPSRRPSCPQHRQLVSHQLAILVAEALARDAAALGSHWERQARSVAPRLHGPDEPGTAATPEGAAAGAPEATGEPRPSELPHSELPRGERMVRAVATALARVAGGQQELVRAGWDLGAGSHGGEQSLHYLLKELNLLSAMLLYACEQALEGEAGSAALAQDGRAPTAAEGMAVARRVQRSVSLLTLAASKGFTHHYLSGMLDHFRMLRHDLRNPLGTIRSAITLMEDQSVEPEMRNHPRFRAMVVRNASNLDRLIGGQLSDDAVLDSALSRQAVSLYEVALAVRRELRDEADACKCTIEVDESLPERELDPVGVELALRTLVSEALSVAAEGSRVRIGFDGTAAGTLCVLVTLDGDRRPGADELLPPSLLEEVAVWSGGGKAVGSRARVQLHFPAIDAEEAVKANDTLPVQPSQSQPSSAKPATPPRDESTQPSV